MKALHGDPEVEVPLDRVARIDGDIVAALHHAGAAAFAEQAFDRDGDVQVGVGLRRVQGRHQARAARADDQDVGLERFDVRGG